MKTSYLAAIVAATVSASCATIRPVAPDATPSGVRFTLISLKARSVALAGSFNHWSTSEHPLARDGSRGLWTLVVALPPGEHLFMYVVDGTWVTPPAAEGYADDGFGGRNGVVVVRP